MESCGKPACPQPDARPEPQELALRSVLSHTLRLLRIAVLLLLALSLAPTPAPARQQNTQSKLAASTGSWTVYHNDDAHTGFDSTLPAASSATTGWTSSTLDGEVFAEPLVYNGMVYAATLGNTVYALHQSDGTEAWHRNVGAPQTGGWACGNISPTGILGTPVIDTTANRIYVVAEITGTTPTYHLFGLDLANLGNIVLDTPIAPAGFDWTIEQERGALAVRSGFVYVPFGGRLGDCGSYHGYVVGVPTSGSTTLNVYQTPSSGSGLWGAGGLAIDDASGNIFGATGNGVSSGCNAVNQNDAVVRLSPTLALQDWFMPQDWMANWCANDQDLGSAGPVLISPNLMFQSGKWGGGFLLNPSALGNVDGQLFPTPKPAAYSQAEVCFGNHSDATFGSFAYAAPFVYVECEGHGLVALNVNTSTSSFSPCAATCAAPDWNAGGTTTFGPPIVAGGAVWVVSNGGGLYGFDALTGRQIYHSASFGANRFVTPAEAGGAIYVPSRNVIRSFNMSFLQWSSLGGGIIGGPDASSWGATRADVFVRGNDNALWHRSWNGTSWAAWESLGGIISADPGAVSWAANRIDVFVRGTDNSLWHRISDGTTWTPWQNLGGGLTSGPDAASWAANQLSVFVRGTDSGLWVDSWNGTTWTWTSLGGVLTSDPGAVSSTANRVDVFVRGTDNGLWQDSWNGTSWTWTSLGGGLTSGPDAASCAAGHLDVFVTGTDGGLWQRGYNGSSWLAWQPLGGPWTADPGAVCPTGTTTIDLFERGPDTALWQSTIPGS
jgi:hypothetical protein